MDAFGAFLGGLIIAGVISGLITAKAQPEIKYEELYRFCLVKNIKLEDCKIPDRPFKAEGK